MEYTTSSDMDVHGQVRAEFQHWVGSRRHESSLTVKFGDEPDTSAIYIWTYLTSSNQAEHLVVYLHDRQFTKWEIKYGDLGDLVRTLQDAYKHPQHPLGLQRAVGSD
ncbi:MAG: hypothetical protein ACYC9J_06975 [Sulfuricaulis sp.]